jgi:UDP-glucuronate 4-epimerase
MRYLITGTAGFIGFHLAHRLLASGHTVVGFDGMTPYYDVALKQKRHDLLKEFETFTGITARLEDRAALDAAADLAKPDVIVHLAAQAGVRYSLKDPRSYVDSNLVGSFNVIDMARHVQPRHLLIASTSSVYGSNEKVPFEEEDRADEPMSLYAATKKSVELMAHSYAHLFNVPTSVFRFFTVYGPWGRPDMALFKFVEAIRQGRPIDVYGEGRMSRDFTYIDDLVDGILDLADAIPAAASRLPDGAVTDSLSRHAPFRAVNIGGGTPVELLRFIEVIEQRLGRTALKNMLPMQPGDMQRTYASPALLKALTNFEPKISLEEGVSRFVTWYDDVYARA